MLVVNMATMGIMDMVHMRTIKFFIVFIFLLLESWVWAKDVQSETSNNINKNVGSETTKNRTKNVPIEMSIITSLSYSDNIGLDHTNERDGFVLSVMPSVSFSKEGSRVKSNLDYSLTGLLYASDDSKQDNEADQYFNSSNDNNQVQHRLNATMASEIIKNSIFLDLDAGISQELLDSNYYSDGESGSQNLTETYTYGITPSWKKKWDIYATSELNYDYNEVIYGNSDNNSGGNNRQDSNQHNIGFDFSSGLAFNLISWDFSYDYSETNYKGNNLSDNINSNGVNDSTSETVKAVFGYNYSRQLELTLTTGYEDYHSSNNTTPSDVGWALGFIWNPNPRNYLALDIGYRFFGTTYRLDYQHTGKRLNWNVSYNEDVTSQRNSMRNNIQTSTDNPDNIVPPIADDDYQEGHLYLNRAGRSDLSYTYGKTTINWGVYHERHYYSDADNENENDYGTDLSWAWLAGKRTTMNTRMSWRVDNNKDLDNMRTRTSLSLSLNRNISPKTSGYIELGYQKADADFKYDEYNENKVSLGLSHQF